MKIKLISGEVHAELQDLFDEYPDLCLQNQGYEYLSPAVRERRAEQISRIGEILREHVAGFAKFHNFKMEKTGHILLRFDYDWGAGDNSHHFVGVGYVRLDDLRDGFPKAASQG